MSRLFSAGFIRLLKDKIFWIGMLVMAGMAGYILLICYKNSIAVDRNATVDGAFFLQMHIVGAAIASFCSMFIGTEYNDGTMRNKLVIGHLRSSIYFSNLIIVCIAGMFMSLTYIAIIACIGIPLFGAEKLTLETSLYYLFTSSMVIVAFSSLFTMLSMSIQNRTIVMNISIMGFFIFMFIGIYLTSALKEQPMWSSYVDMDTAGNIITVPAEVNPNYISGLKREVYTFLVDFLPSGQNIQLATGTATFKWCLPVYSLLVTMGSTLIGLFSFYKKDIK